MKSIIKRMFSFLLVAITIFNSTAMGSYAAEKQNAVKLKESLGIGRQHTFAIDEYGNMYEIVGNNVFSILASDERIVLATYTLSKEETKTMASNIRTVTNASWMVAEVLLSLFPGYGIPSSICLNLARNSTFNNDVIYAADHDMRVKVTITDSKNNHTSYSTQVTYQVVY